MNKRLSPVIVPEAIKHQLRVRAQQQKLVLMTNIKLQPYEKEFLQKVIRDAERFAGPVEFFDEKPVEHFG
jgi:hypothetical protein